MADVFTKIRDLEGLTAMSKHERLIAGMIQAIDDNMLSRGDMLPSVNAMSKKTGFARMTVVKAYHELRDRGLIESFNRRGYFVANESTDQIVKVALIMYAFHPFQENFYNAFREGLGENIELEVFFHHNNIEVFEAILTKINARFGMYVIAPPVHQKSASILAQIPTEKMLLVDRWVPLEYPSAHITQEFESSTLDVLERLLPSLLDYERVILFYAADADYPEGILKGFSVFTQRHGINGLVKREYQKGMLEAKSVYITIGDGDLWRLLKDCKRQGIEVGEDIGILSANDGPAKEIVMGGITTFSVDFEQMGQQAAAFVRQRETIRKILPTNLVRRQSL